MTAPVVVPSAVKTVPVPNRHHRDGTKADRGATQHNGQATAAAKSRTSKSRTTRRRRVRPSNITRAIVSTPTRSVPTFPPFPMPPSTLNVEEFLVDTPRQPVFTPTANPPESEQKVTNRPRRRWKDDGGDARLFDRQVSEKCTVYWYNIQMRDLGKKKDLKACLRLLTEMRSEGLSPDKYTYSSILACCARTNSVDIAIDLFYRMKAEKVPIDNYIRTNLLTVASTSSPPRIDMCARIFRSTEAPSFFMCNVMMDAYARVGRVEDCLSTYRYMSLRKMRADRYTVSALVKAYVKADRLDEAVEKMHEMHAAGLEVSAVAFGQVMDAFGRKGAMDNAVSIFDSMTLYGVAPTQITYNILIGCCAHVFQTDRAFEIFEEMKATSSFHGDRYTFHSLMKCCLRIGDGHRALELYRKIKAATFPCNQVSYRMALTAAGQVMDIDAIQEVAGDMVAHKNVPRDDTAATLVAAAIRCSDLESALRYFGDYLKLQTSELKVAGIFDSIRAALKTFEITEGHAHLDFEYTILVVDELERNWRQGL